MLVEFRVSNFRSIKEEQALSLVASSDKTHDSNLIHHEKFDLLKAAAIHGPNASGKSNLIAAIKFMEEFVTYSATRMNQGDKIKGVTPFRLDPDSQNNPSSFEVTVIVGKTRFEYGFSVTPNRIHEEWLTAYPAQRPQRWLERKYNRKDGKTMWVFRGPLKVNSKILRERTRDNGLVLSRGAELNIQPLSELFLWFRNNLLVLDLSEDISWLVQKTARMVINDVQHINRVTRLLQHADLGIDSVSITEKPLKSREVPDEVREVLSTKGIERLTESLELDRKQVSISTLHFTGDPKRTVEFNFLEAESNGTQRLFALSGPFLDALDNGFVVFVDELECSIHSLLTRKLIELFQSAQTNQTGAQLVFATHDSTLMDPELFRRDQIWLVEKNRFGASEFFSLYDLNKKRRPRNTEALQRNYLAGRYGGVPKFGPTLEDQTFDE